MLPSVLELDPDPATNVDGGGYQDAAGKGGLQDPSRDVHADASDVGPSQLHRRGGRPESRYPAVSVKRTVASAPIRFAMS